MRSVQLDLSPALLRVVEKGGDGARGAPDVDMIRLVLHVALEEDLLAVALVEARVPPLLGLRLIDDGVDVPMHHRQPCDQELNCVAVAQRERRLRPTSS